MKKILWTTIFWIIVFLGFAFYAKMFDANMSAGISTWLGATTITTSGELIATGADAGNEVMSGINAIQTTLADMQTTLNTLAGTTATPTVTPTPVVEVKTTSTGN